MTVGLRSLLRAFLLSPLAAAAVLVVWAALFRDSRLPRLSAADLLVVSGVYTLFSYVATIVVGVPLALAYRRLRLRSVANHAVGGTAAGMLFGITLFATTYGFGRTLSERWPEIVASGLAGLAAGLTFRALTHSRGSDASVVGQFGRMVAGRSP